MNAINQQVIATLTRRIETLEKQVMILTGRVNSPSKGFAPNEVMPLPKQQDRALGAQDWINRLRMGDFQFFLNVETEADNEHFIATWLGKRGEPREAKTIRVYELAVVINNHFNTTFSSHDIGRMIAKAGLTCIRTRRYIGAGETLVTTPQQRCIQVWWERD